MKIKVKHLGALREAEFTLGELTIICGGNNTGKTYATYALFGFLYTWQRMLSIQINDDKIEELLADGVIRIDIQEYVKKSEQIIIKACERYTKELPKIFAAPIDRFKNTEFNISLEIKTEDIKLKNKFDRKMGSANAEIFSITKSEESTELLPKFKNISSLSQINCFEYQLIFSSDSADSQWEILAIATNAEKVDTQDATFIINKI
jgi:hypothetical protein